MTHNLKDSAAVAVVALYCCSGRSWGWQLGDNNAGGLTLSTRPELLAASPSGSPSSPGFLHAALAPASAALDRAAGEGRAAVAPRTGTLHRAGVAGGGGRPAADPRHRQFLYRSRRADHDLCHAGLGPQHRGRPGWAAGPRLCRLLRGRRLLLRACCRITSGLVSGSALPLAGLLAAAWGVFLGFPVLRLRGDYLAIVTLAFGEIIRLVITNWTSLTGGPNGIYDIPHPTLFGLTVQHGWRARHLLRFLRHRPGPVAAHHFSILHHPWRWRLLTNWVTLRLRRQPLGPGLGGAA